MSTPILESIKRFIPPLTGKLHKGQAGKIGVLGGSREYTGAPYYAAYTSLKTGCDISHIFCTESAGTAIKAYSPELIVHPFIKTSESLSKSLKKEDLEAEKESIAKEVVEHISPWLQAIHVLIVGPGLGRDDLVMYCVKKIIDKAKQNKLPLVIDGDGLYLLSTDISIISGYPLAIITPNVNEFSRLCDAAKVDKEPKLENLAKSLGNVTVVRKGEFDTISNGNQTLECKEEGSPRRSGGQGDMLSGTIGTLFAWAQNYQSNNPEESKKSEYPSAMLAAYGGCTLTRRSSKAAFAKHLRSTTTPNMIEELGGVFERIWPAKL